MLALLLACVPAAVYGLRFDGSMPLNSEIVGVGGAFPGSTGASVDLGDTAVAGLQARQRLSEGVALQLAGGLAAGTLEANPSGVLNLEVQGRLLNEAPITVSALAGLDTFGQADAESLMFGAHAGLVASKRIARTVRPYVGITINPVYLPGDRVYPWLQYGGGVSWRPKLADATRGLLAVEATSYRGYGADVVNEVDLNTWGFMVQLGASFGNDEPPRR